MRETRDEILLLVQRFACGDPAAETFLWRMRNRAALARIEDDNGDVGIIPNEAPAQHLVERVLSLVAADYIVRPLDYEERVVICWGCKTVVFAPGARARGVCNACDQVASGVRPRIDLNQIDMSGSKFSDDPELLRAYLTSRLVKQTG